MNRMKSRATMLVVNVARSMARRTSVGSMQRPRLRHEVEERRQEEQPPDAQILGTRSGPERLDAQS
jgi:hypothetical protein